VPAGNTNLGEPATYEPDDSVALRPGQHIVLVELAVGPWRGGEIASVEIRPGSYAAALEQIRALTPATLQRFSHSVVSAIRAKVEAEWILELSSENDAALMGDLLLLGALRSVAGEEVLAEAGVSRLSVLSPDCPDDGRGPWRTRIEMAH
jgi:hypothetical protein